MKLEGIARDLGRIVAPNGTGRRIARIGQDRFLLALAREIEFVEGRARDQNFAADFDHGRRLGRAG